MSESEEAFESADEDVDESKPKKRGRTTSERLGEIKETEPPDCKGQGGRIVSRSRRRRGRRQRRPRLAPKRRVKTMRQRRHQLRRWVS
ncbi:hypothetical protein MRX96_026570 [Rhipicephalus microplus]